MIKNLRSCQSTVLAPKVEELLQSLKLQEEEGAQERWRCARQEGAHATSVMMRVVDSLRQVFCGLICVIDDQSGDDRHREPQLFVMTTFTMTTTTATTYYDHHKYQFATARAMS